MFGPLYDRTASCYSTEAEEPIGRMTRKTLRVGGCRDHIERPYQTEPDRDAARTKSGFALRLGGGRLCHADAGGCGNEQSEVRVFVLRG